MSSTTQDVPKDTDEDTRQWLKKAKKRSKQNALALAKRRAQEQEELDEAALANAYSEKDLEGLRVAHGKKAFDDGEEHILVLKDSNVVDDQDDELLNVNLAEHERTDERIDLKKRGKTAYDYTGYDDDEFTDRTKKGVLSKYNEEIDGKGPGDGFQLSGSVAMDTEVKEEDVKPATETARQVQRDMLTLDYLKEYGGSDYKPGKSEKAPKLKKRKKTHSSRKALDDDDLVMDEKETNDDSMDVDTKPTIGKRKEYEDTGAADDDDLQLALARQRRQKIKERKVKKSDEQEEDMMVKREENGDNTFGTTENGIDEDDGRIVINDTAEFVRGISIVKPEEKRPSATITKDNVKTEPSSSSLPAPASTSSINNIQNENLIEVDANIKDEQVEDVEDGYGEEQEIKQELDEKNMEDEEKEEVEDERVTMTSSSRSLSSTLSVLKRQGLLKPVTATEREQDNAVKDAEQWKSKWRAEEMRRERERLETRDSMTHLTDEQRREENIRRNKELARKDLEQFKDYKPAIEIKYHDEFGRDLTPMEAWKSLSHRFHGKTSGAAKTEKRLRKIEEEQMRERMASGDTPLNTNAAFQARQQKMGSATMILSIGNKGAAPQDESAYLADTRADKLQKGNSGNKKSKGKGKAAAGQSSSTAIP